MCDAVDAAAAAAAAVSRDKAEIGGSNERMDIVRTYVINGLMFGCAIRGRPRGLRLSRT
jgi:hypothetical protein